jgi:hypothetical protein
VVLFHLCQVLKRPQAMPVSARGTITSVADVIAAMGKDNLEGITKEQMERSILSGPNPSKGGSVCPVIRHLTGLLLHLVVLSACYLLAPRG